MEVFAYTGQFWTSNKMPDTKSGIKHLSNMASMHQNIFLSLQNVFNKQFKSNMKIYSKEINVIKEDLVRLQREKERYQKQDESYKKAMNLSIAETTSEGEPELTQKEPLVELRRQNALTNASLANKVSTFSNEHSGLGPTSVGEGDAIGEAARDSKNYVPTSSPLTGFGRKLEKVRSNRLFDKRKKMEDLAEDDEEDAMSLGNYDTESQKRVSNSRKRHDQYSVYKPNFLNDRFVNTTVNNARARLTSLYRQSILGPSSRRRNISLLLPMNQGPTRPSTANSLAQPQSHSVRTQSAAVNNSKGRSQRRKSQSARRPADRNHPSDSISTTKPAQLPMEVVENINPEEEARTKIQRREQFLSSVKEGRNVKYNEFEDALHRRMMIREMKAAEYDANHSTRSNITLQEVIPSKASSTGMSEALRRQSAIIALERSIMGGV